MEVYRLQSNDVDIHVECPKCDMWEQLSVDDPRHRLNVLPITEWLPEKENEHEESIHECVECKTKFKVIWDYDNPLE